MLTDCKALIADRGYDDSKLIIRLFDGFDIRPIIDIRNFTKDGDDKTKKLAGYDNVVFDYKSTVYCYCPKELKRRTMAYGGFEQKRGTLKYRCPAKHYGRKCAVENSCPVKESIRICMEQDRRTFLPLPRTSPSWESHYSKHTAVERVNSRLDVSFGFELHYIRGLKKMRLRCSLALCIMLAMAIGRVKGKRPDLMRSLVKAA